MATLAHDTYRRPLLGAMDDLFSRCLAGATIVGVLFLIAVLIAPIRRHAITSVEELPQRFARLIIEKPKAKPAPAADAKPVVVETPKAAPAPPPPAPEPVRPTPRTLRSETAPVPPDAGKAGRERARQEVAATLATTSATLEKSLSSLSSALGSTRDDAARPSRTRRPSVRSGRSGGELGSAEGTLAGGASSADLGGSVVQGAAVAIGTIGSAPSAAGATGSDAVSRSGSAPGVYRSNASLLAVVQKYAAGIQYCYDRELKRDPSLAGKLVVALAVAASGDVIEASVVENSVGSSRLADCALSQIREWKFPRIEGGVTTFQTPFVFTPPR